MKETYKTATDNFLREFDRAWEQMLETLDVGQAQLATGNRLRPQICLWGYLSTIPPIQVAAHNYTQIANVAVSIEMIHKASLLLDDWIDGDQERRGLPAFHAEYSPEQAVLFSLNMIGLAMLRLENIFVRGIVLPHHYYLCLDTLVKTIYLMAKGALKELQLQGNDFFDSEKVREITQLETSEIIGNSLLLGYYTGIGDKHNIIIETIFKQMGDKCGFLFQALNDLEVFSNPEKLSAYKGSINVDIESQRKNLAIATLYELANKSDREKILQIDTEELLQMMNKYRVVNTMKNELKNIFFDVLSSGVELHRNGMSAEWCEGLQCFLNYVKEYAEERLKG